MVAEAWILALVLSAASGLPQDAATVDRPADSAASFLAAGDAAGALRAAERIEDPLERAEWRFHVLHSSGDLPAALAAARQGLAQKPDHPALLVNATVCALALGLGESASDSATRLASVANELRDEVLGTRAKDLVRQASDLRHLEEQGRGAITRARWSVGAAMAAGLAAMVWLSRRRP